MTTNISAANDIRIATALAHMYASWAKAWSDCAYHASRHERFDNARRAKRHAEESASNAEWFAAQANSAAYLAEIEDDSWEDWYLIDDAWSAADAAHRMADEPLWLGD